jgi:hypothetical protein
MRQPEPIRDPLVNYVVLALAFVFEGTSWAISLRQFNAVRGPLGFFEAVRRSKDPPSFVVLLEDSAALMVSRSRPWALTRPPATACRGSMVSPPSPSASY